MEPGGILANNDNMQSMGVRSPDPFIVARMAEVDTTVIKANILYLQNYGTRNAYSSRSARSKLDQAKV
ncbi:MAG: hypothetical protein IPH45_19075 [Bacteroidales bacterium]|nr:hypothetical protein [Bacteroidales bacterium]